MDWKVSENAVERMVFVFESMRQNLWGVQCTYSMAMNSIDGISNTSLPLQIQ